MAEKKILDRCWELGSKILNPNATQKDVDDVYLTWSENYHEDLQDPAIKYGGPKTTAQELEKLYPNNKNIYILDAPAGTGLVAETLNALGYTNIDGLEPNDAMFSKAKELKTYKKYYSEYMGTNKLPIPDNTYDAIISCGSFYSTHVKGDCFPELIRITKPGGHIMILTGEEDSISGEVHTVYIAGLDTLAADLQAAGKWKQIQRTTIPVPEYYHDDRGALFVYQVL